MTQALALAGTLPLVATASIALPADTDALALLEAIPGAPSFFWERQEAGVAIAGVGTAWSADASGGGRFRRCAAALAALPDGAVAVGGFAFDDAPCRGAWRAFPAALWRVPRVAIVRRGGAARLVACGEPRDDLAALLHHTAAQLGDTPVARPAARRYALGVRRDAVTWRRQVERTLAAIHDGRLAKLVLARTATVRADQAFDPLRVVRRLRAGYPGCAVFAVRQGDATVVGASPERLVAVEGRRLATAALAGTVGRGGGPSADRRLAETLRHDPKERAEHALVVDDVRARLAGICHEVQAPDEPAVLATETLQHLHTPIVARLRTGAGLLDAVAALHPTPAICGTPRAAALAALRRHEGIVRGWYGGGVGWIAGDTGEISVALRAGLLCGRSATLYAGAGIVAGSQWERELEETRLKLRPLLGALLEL